MDSKTVYYYDSKKRYIGTSEAYLDPLETQKKGSPVFLLPADSTFIKPLEHKDGLDIVFDVNKQVWGYSEPIPEPIPENRKPKELTPLQKKTNELISYYDELSLTDYTVIKAVEALYKDKIDPEIIKKRAAAREKINKLRPEIDALIKTKAEE